jgi:dienelactone hydrolase
MRPRIESLLSARLFLAPRVARGRVYFVSDLTGRLSLFAMDARPGGSVPEPLLPPSIALQNPELIGGMSFAVFPALDRVLVMIDRDGDENYQPFVVPLTGGEPVPAFGEQLAGHRVRMAKADPKAGIVYLLAESKSEPIMRAYRGMLAQGELEPLGESMWGAVPAASDPAHTRVLLAEGYTFGDTVLYERRAGESERSLLLGKPIEARAPGEAVPISGITAAEYTTGEQGILLVNAIHSDQFGLGYVPLAKSAAPDLTAVEPVTVAGTVHAGDGELTGLEHLDADRYLLHYNIDGCSWLYTGRLDEGKRRFAIERVIVGREGLAGGVVEAVTHDPVSDTLALSFCTATSPSQIITVTGSEPPIQHTRERLLGIESGWLAPGEDASFTSVDGLRISARLYRPAPALGYAGPRPLVYYIHGGPQGQERPNFTWFSMPLIQFLTLRGFAVFVGGMDRMDHCHAMTKVLSRDPGLDLQRAGVIGRSYGGYMTLTLASRHPDLWAAAVDMFGPYDLLTFTERIPETWKPYFSLAVGDPVRDRDFLIERSPATYIEAVRCPLLVIQGKNDPRVIERESRDVVERLRGLGKTVDYLMFEDEGHDVLKYPNKVRCYNAIADFFATHLAP